MERTQRMNFEHITFGKRMKSMLSVDFRRMFTMPLFYVMGGIAVAIPVLVLVMTSSLGGTSTAGTEAFTNAWQVVEALSGESSGISTDMTSMCNINLLFFMAAVLVCIFTADDFRSGYAKNLFTVRSKKAEYVISKTLVGITGGALMILAYLVGTIAGGAVAGLSFDAGAAGTGGIVMCLLAKMFLMAVFVAIFVLWSVVGKQKLWMSMVGSLGSGMLLFTMIPMLSPLNSGIMNVLLCLVGGALFSCGLGAVSDRILSKTSLV